MLFYWLHQKCFRGITHIMYQWILSENISVDSEVAFMLLYFTG